jgi:hypothetical protein
VRLDDRVLAFLTPGLLQGDVGQHFVGVHVGGRAGAPLVPVDQKLIVVFAVSHGLRRLLDGRQFVLAHRTHVSVRLRRRKLHDGPGFDESRVVIDWNSRDLEILEGPGRLHAVVGIRRDLLFPDEILFGSRLSGVNSRLSGRLHRRALHGRRSVRIGRVCRRRRVAGRARPSNPEDNDERRKSEDERRVSCFFPNARHDCLPVQFGSCVDARR